MLSLGAVSSAILAHKHICLLAHDSSSSDFQSTEQIFLLHAGWAASPSHAAFTMSPTGSATFPPLCGAEQHPERDGCSQSEHDVKFGGAMQQ